MLFIHFWNLAVYFNHIYILGQSLDEHCYYAHTQYAYSTMHTLLLRAYTVCLQYYAYTTTTRKLYACIYIYMRTSIHTFWHTYIHTNIHPYMHAHTRVRTYVHTCIHACTHARTYVHTYTHVIFGVQLDKFSTCRERERESERERERERESARACASEREREWERAREIYR